MFLMIKAALLERVEQLRSDLESGQAIDEKGERITDENLRGGLKELRFCLALPELLEEECLVADVVDKLKGDKDGEE